MSNNPVLWSSIGFWILIIGLVGDFVVLFIPLKRLEKTLAAIFTVLIAIGVTVEHMADAKRFGPRMLNSSQEQAVIDELRKFAHPIKGQAWTERADINVNPVTFEGVALARQIESMLKAAEWNAGIMQAEANGPFSALVSGVMVRPTSESASASCANALVRVLRANGIQAFTAPTVNFMGCGSMPPMYNRQKDPFCFMLVVVVGSRP